MAEMLLVIDMQGGFRSVASEAIVENILALRRSFQGEVVFSKFINRNGSLFEKQLGWTGLQTKHDRALFSELEAPGNIEMEHDSYTVLTDVLIRFIREKNITTFYLCGIYTDVCVLKTAMDLFDRGYSVFVIADACSSFHGEQHHNSAIESLRHIIGEQHVLSTADIVALCTKG